MNEEGIHGDEDYVAEQEAEAAREAAAVGGDPGGDYGVDESERALAEAGQGEAEGFELAEEELIEHASHGDPGPDPSNLAGAPENFRGDEGGEADHEHSSEDDEDR